MSATPPTLGTILSAALIGDLAAQAMQAEQRLAERAQVLAAERLSRELAPLLGVSEAKVFEELTYVPDNMLPLLQSPEGWMGLAAWVAADLGVPAPHYQPTRH